MLSYWKDIISQDLAESFELLAMGYGTNLDSYCLAW